MNKYAKKGYYGIGIYHSKNILNIGTLWRTANVFGAAFIFTIGRRYKQQSSDTMNTPQTIPLYEYVDFDSFKKNLPKLCRLVAVEINDSAKNVINYIHPTQAAYILGAEDYGMPDEILDKCHDVIKIPGYSCLNVSVAGSIVLYDRICKGKGYQSESVLKS